MASSHQASKWWAAIARADLDSQFILEPIGSPITDFRILFANEAGGALLGRSPDSLVGALMSAVTPPYGSGFRADLAEAHHHGRIIRRLTRSIAPEISATQAEYRIVPFDGLLAVAVTDRSPEYAAEEQSAFLGRMLAAEIETSLTASAVLRPIVDDDGVVVDATFENANDGLAALFGRTRAEVVGARFYSLVEQRTGGIIEMIGRCFHTRQAISEEYDARRSPVVSQWLHVRLSPVGPFVIVHAEDVSVRRREEAALRAIVESTIELIALSDRNGYMEYVNPAARRTLGWSEESINARSILDLVHADERAGVLQDFANMASGHVVRARRQNRLVGANGDTRTVFGSTVAMRAADDSIDGFVTVVADITERLASEDARAELAAQLAVAEQRERGRLAEDLHDGPVQDLTALSMRLGGMIDRLSDRPLDRQPSVDDVTTLLRRSEDLVVNAISELRTVMFRLSPPDLEGLGFGQALRSRAEKIFAGTNITVGVHGGVEIDPSQDVLSTAFRLAQEALVNARKHSGASNVTITLSSSDDDRELFVEIADDGCGADEEAYLRHRDGHLGIGMMIDRARQLGGTCEVTGRLGEGTTVRLRLPLAPARLTD
jgi:PAS domain S-box-containing protein